MYKRQVQDRVTLELFRGCIRGCRFCQAGYVYRPVRSRSPKLLAEYGKAACQDSGYQEIDVYKRQDIHPFRN